MASRPISVRNTEPRDWDWIAEFEQTAWQMGFATTTMYEYHIAMYMYTEAPRVEKVTWLDEQTVRLSFNKRIDWLSARNLEQFLAVQEAGSTEPHPTVNTSSVRVDGNRALLTSKDRPTHWPPGSI